MKPWSVRIFEDFPLSFYIVAASESDEGLVLLFLTEASHIRYQVSDTNYLISSIMYQVSDTKYKIRGTGHDLSIIKYEISNINNQLSIINYPV